MISKRKKYDGYQSFSYLEPGKDYKEFKLAKQVGRVNSTIIQLSKTEEERVQEIFEKYLTISTHDHLEVFPEEPAETVEYLRRGRLFTGYEGIAASGLDVIFAALSDGVALAKSPDAWAWENVVHQIGMFISDVDHQDLAFIARRIEDIPRAHDEGKTAIIIHLESTPHIGTEFDKVDVLYGFGVRVMGITYSEGNEFASGIANKHDGGLTDQGYNLVERMNKLGIAIDISHSSDKTSLDVIEASKKPVFITHAGARALWPSRRMKPDNIIQALAEKGGVIGVEAAPHTTLTYNNRRHSIESVMEHFEYIVKLVGIDHVAFGPDTLFGDHVALHHTFAKELSITTAFRDNLPEFQEVPFVDGLENPSEYPNIVRWLVKHGYSDQDIAKVVGENAFRVIKQTWCK
ncbi:MAG: membrane dipeptidase [Nitrososphaeria archaeon]|nr:membrane dipeptidase [Nitrososphaeria archaeon]